jgi:4,5-dihydroxyphthalate decarboxylase
MTAAKLPVQLTCADYARLLPLARGEVMPEGIELTLTLGRRGSWDDRNAMLRRALNDPMVQGGESSFCRHAVRIAQGDRSHVALPVFPLRGFTIRDLYAAAGSPITSIAQLAGKRIGMYGWANSGAVWYRHLLATHGVDIAGVRWCIGPVDDPMPATSPEVLPPGVTTPPEGGSLSAMLIEGELDAVFSPPRPRAYHRSRGPIIRLVRDWRAEEARYFKQTGLFPTQHLVVIRRALWEAHPWVARALTEAFIAGNDAFTEAQRNFPYATPWLEDELERTEALLGEDFHPYGFEPNRLPIAAFAEQAWNAGIIAQRLSPEALFAEYLDSATLPVPTA